MSDGVDMLATPAAIVTIDLVDRVERGPSALSGEVVRLLATATATGDIAGQIICLVATSVIERLAGRITAAADTLHKAQLLVDSNTAVELVEVVGLNLVPVLAHQGLMAEALEQLDQLEHRARPTARGVIGSQRAGVLYRSGRITEAYTAYDVLLADTTIDSATRAKSLANRAILHLELGTPASALTDLAEAERLFRSCGHDLEAARALHNTGYVHARMGAAAAALACFHRAASREAKPGYNRGIALLDRADTLIAAGLVVEAEEVARDAAQTLCDDGNHLDGANAQLVAAQAARLSASPHVGMRHAEQALQLFLAQDRPGWSTAARLELFRCREAAGDASPDEGLAIMEIAQRQGMVGTSVTARVVTAIVATQRGNPALAQQLIGDGFDTITLQSSDRMLCHLTKATVNLAVPAVALAYARNGMNDFADHQAMVGGTEIRAHASRYGAALAELGIRESLRAGRPTLALSWINRYRASSLRYPPARPPDDSTSADEFNRLRAAVSQLRDPDIAPEKVDELRQHRSELERNIRERMRRTGGAESKFRLQPPSIRQIAEAARGSTVVWFVELDRELLSISLSDGRIAHSKHGCTRPIQRELVSLRSALRTMADCGAGAAAHRDAAMLVRHSAAELDQLLLAQHRGSAPLVIIPPASMHAIPWEMLPSCHGRSVTVSPSALAWWRVQTPVRRQPGPPRIVAIGGPSVQHVDTELAAVAACYRRTDVLSGESATVANVADSLHHVDVAHVCAHGTFRADNPLFTSIELFDGPLTVFEIEQIRQPARVLVLSSCNLGLSASPPGDELMGLSAALLSVGTSSLVAAVGPVPESTAVTDLMVRLHQGLAHGKAPSASLAESYQSLDPDDPASFALRVFVCLGGG